MLYVCIAHLLAQGEFSRDPLNSDFLRKGITDMADTVKVRFEPKMLIGWREKHG